MLQGMQLKWLWPLAIIAGLTLWASPMNSQKFLIVHDALVIKAYKNSPPHIAFEEVLESEKKIAEWTSIANKTPVTLATVETKTLTPPLLSHRIELPEMVVRKSVELVGHGSVATRDSQSQEDMSWIEQLPRAQAARLREAHYRNEVLAQSWEEQSFADRAREVIEKTSRDSEASTHPGVYVAAVNNQGHHVTSVPAAQVRTAIGYSGSHSLPSATDTEVEEKQNTENGFLPSMQTIVGPLEITGGLAITNDHHIEIRRSDEGILKELGRVDLQQGLYKISVESTTGSVVARLVSREGKTLGEGSIRLNKVTATSGENGPKLKITPHPDYSGIVTSAYNPKADDVAPAQSRVTFVKGVSDVPVRKDGTVSMDNVAKGSTTVMRVAAPHHYQTTSIIVSGQEFRSQLYPESMMKALENIIAQQRNLTFAEQPSIIWGKAILDGKPVAGIEVTVEADEGLQPVYFNQFLIPDPSLKATSENGLYAFVDAPLGFQSLLATRGDSIFGYQNVVVEEGAVAQGDIESSIKSESVPLRLYDAFTGEPRSATVTIQSLQESVEVQDGTAVVRLPQVQRLGMMRVQPEGTDYIAARYLYRDKDEYLHIPLVQWSWLRSIKTFLKLDDHPSAGVIVGFVPDEDFEVYLAGYDNFDQNSIVYFDMQGRLLQNRKGIMGGGFILYNVPEDIHEVVVLGQRTQKMHSQVLPVDANSLSILSFRN
ncbi:MAG: hypothetical protein AAGB31_03005 [Bdellovibrio sp.]